MKIPLLDMRAQLGPIRSEIDAAIAKVIDKGAFILGEEVKLLEDEICAYSGSKCAIGVSNGTDAIVLALNAMDIGRSDKVICPSFTYYATCGAVIHAGAEPILIDIDPKTYCISPQGLSDYLKKNRKTARSVKAIIPVHLYGQCADMDSIKEIAKKYGIKVIEDTAQAFGASYKHDKAGTIGDCGTISFFPGKNLGACGDAGMVLTDDEKLAARLRILRNQGADPKDKYNHIYLGHNNRLDTLQAAVLRVKLKYIDSWNMKRQEKAAYYDNELKDTGLLTPYVPDSNAHVYHQYILRSQKRSVRNAIVDNLHAKGIDSRVYYPIPLHLQTALSYLGYKKGDLPESEKASQETFAIPVYPELNRQQMDYIIETIKGAL